MNNQNLNQNLHNMQNNVMWLIWIKLSKQRPISVKVAKEF
jgi:hypothetical protein